jgi:hypothetical protein
MERQYFVDMRLCVLVVLCCLCAVGCAASISKEGLKVPSISMPNVERVESQRGSVSMDVMKDSRADTVLVQLGASPVETVGDVTGSVSTAMRGVLEKAGFLVSDSAPIVIVPQIRKWKARVRSGLPATVDAQAEVFVEVLDPADKLLYSGVYQGSSTLSQPSIHEAEIESTLASAMSEALEQLVADLRLVRILSSF